LVQRGIKVTAIDNGRIDQRLMDSGRVQHLREDGFRYRPAKTVDWLVCDMVEKPDRVAELVVRWFREGLCRAAIFNLKLPMKRRFEAWQRARESLTPLLRQGYALRARQLYHDREEITVAVVPTAAVVAAPPPRAARTEPAPAAKSPRPAPSGDAAPLGKDRRQRSRAEPAATGKAVRQGGRATPVPAARPPRGKPARPGKSAAGPAASRNHRVKSRPPRSR
jgi:hypothetical protein